MATIIINIDDGALEEIHKHGLNSNHVLDSIAEKAIINGTVLPFNATNGNVIKTIFPNHIISEELATNSMDVVFNIDRIKKRACRVEFGREWWNSQYEGTK